MINSNLLTKTYTIIQGDEKSWTKQVGSGLEDLRKSQSKGGEQIQDIRSDSGQNIGSLKIEVSELEKDESRHQIDLMLWTRITSIETYFYDDYDVLMTDEDSIMKFTTGQYLFTTQGLPS